LLRSAVDEFVKGARILHGLLPPSLRSVATELVYRTRWGRQLTADKPATASTARHPTRGHLHHPRRRPNPAQLLPTPAVGPSRSRPAHSLMGFCSQERRFRRFSYKNPSANAPRGPVVTGAGIGVHFRLAERTGGPRLWTGDLRLGESAGRHVGLDPWRWSLSSPTPIPPNISGIPVAAPTAFEGARDSPLSPIAGGGDLAKVVAVMNRVGSGVGRVPPGSGQLFGAA